MKYRESYRRNLRIIDEDTNDRHLDKWFRVRVRDLCLLSFRKILQLESLKICAMFCSLNAMLLIVGDTITRCRYRWSTSPYDSYATRGYDFRSRQKRPPPLFLPSLPRSFRCVSRYARCKTRRARICAPCDNPDVPKRCVFSLRLPWDFLTRRTSPVFRDHMNDLTKSGVYQVYLFLYQTRNRQTRNSLLPGIFIN